LVTYVEDRYISNKNDTTFLLLSFYFSLHLILFYDLLPNIGLSEPPLHLNQHGRADARPLLVANISQSFLDVQRLSEINFQQWIFRPFACDHLNMQKPKGVNKAEQSVKPFDLGELRFEKGCN
jgi:hypothetical protein